MGNGKNGDELYLRIAVAVFGVLFVLSFIVAGIAKSPVLVGISGVLFLTSVFFRSLITGVIYYSAYEITKSESPRTYVFCLMGYLVMDAICVYILVRFI